MSRIGQIVMLNGVTLTIISEVKGRKTNKPVYQSGIMPNGFKSTPKKYVLSDGSVCKGKNLKFLVNA